MVSAGRTGAAAAGAAALALALVAGGAGAAPPVKAADPARASTVDPKRRELRAKTEATLARLSDGLAGTSGYLIRDLGTGETFARNADVVFPAASTIKLPVVLELFKQAEEGGFDLSAPLTIEPKSRVEGGGVLERFVEPYPALSAAHLAVLMMDFSDNYATNLLIDRIGMERVGRRMAGWGFADTLLRRKMMDTAAARAGRENVSTPRDMAGLLEKLQRGELLSPEHTRRVIAIMKGDAGTWIKRGLPATIEVADKEGDLEGVRCDSGLVFVPGAGPSDPSRPFAISVMTAYLADGEAGVVHIGAVARAAFDYFLALSQSSEHGRRLGA
jgi:beta-lactamase class A